MSSDDFYLNTSVYENFEKDDEKSDATFWKREIGRWKHKESLSWPTVDHKSEIDSVVSSIVGDFRQAIQDAYDNGKSFDGIRLTQEFYWRFSAKDFTEEAHSGMLPVALSPYVVDLQFPEEMPPAIFNALSEKRRKKVAKAYLREVTTKLFEKWQETVQYLPNNDDYALTLRQTSMGQWKGKKAQLRQLFSCFSPNNNNDFGNIGYYRWHIDVVP